jgi:DNA-binding beta-propeller fold protein YncE
LDSVSVLEFATREVKATWRIPGGGSPDMGSVSPDGAQLWFSGRNSGEVYVWDTRSGELVEHIKLGKRPHGLTFFPQPGRYSLGHTGVYR